MTGKQRRLKTSWHAKSCSLASFLLAYLQGKIYTLRRIFQRLLSDVQDSMLPAGSGGTETDHAYDRCGLRYRPA